MINLLAMLRPITQKGTDVQTGLPGTAGGSEESLGGFAALIQKLVGEFVGGRTPSKSDLEAGANNSSQSLTSEAATTADAPPAAGVSRPPAGMRPMAVSTKKKEEEKAVGRYTGDSTQIAPQVTSTALTETLAAVYAMLQDQVPTPKAPLAEGEKTPACEADGGKGSPSATGPASVSSLTAGKISSLFAHGITAQSILSFPLGSNPTHSDAQSADGESGPPPTNEAKTERPGTLVLDMLKTVSASKMMTQAAEDFTNSLKASSPQDGSAGTVTRGRVNWTPPKEGVPAAQPADPEHLEGDLAIQSNPDPKQLEGVLAVQSNPDPKHLEGVLAIQSNLDLKASPSNPPQGEQATHSATGPEHPEALAKEATTLQPTVAMVIEATPTSAKPDAARTRLSVQAARGAERSSSPAHSPTRTFSPQTQGDTSKEPTTASDKAPLRQISVNHQGGRPTDSEPYKVTSDEQEKVQPAETAGPQAADAQPGGRKQQAEPEQSETARATQGPLGASEATDSSAVRVLSAGAHPEIAAAKPTLIAPTIKETSSPYSAAPGEFSWKIADQVIRTMKLQMTDGASEMRLTLKPPSLGDVQLSVRVEDAKMNAQIDVSQQVVKSAIEAHLPQLRQTLQEQGIDVQRIEVLLPDQYSRREGSGSGADGSGRHSAKQLLSVDDSESIQAQKDLGYNTIELIM